MYSVSRSPRCLLCMAFVRAPPLPWIRNHRNSWLSELADRDAIVTALQRVCPQDAGYWNPRKAIQSFATIDVRPANQSRLALKKLKKKDGSVRFTPKYTCTRSTSIGP